MKIITSILNYRKHNKIYATREIICPSINLRAVNSKKTEKIKTPNDKTTYEAHYTTPEEWARFQAFQQISRDPTGGKMMDIKNIINITNKPQEGLVGIKKIKNKQPTTYEARDTTAEEWNRCQALQNMRFHKRNTYTLMKFNK